MSGQEERDAAATERDSETQNREDTAERRENATDGRGTPGGRSASEQAQAAQDRDGAARDREQAARDRKLAARDRSLAGIDALTGALRRDRGLADLQREIERVRRSHEPLTLAFVDADGLRAVNDGQGHAAGDRALRSVSEVMLSRLCTYDPVVRYGGDEFLCALPGAGLLDARQRFDGVKDNVRRSTSWASVSVGLAVLEDADTVEGLIARTDAALYAGRRVARKPVDS